MSDEKKDLEDEIRRRLDELERRLREVDEMRENLRVLTEDLRKSRREKGVFMDIERPERLVSIKVGDELIEPGVEIATNLVKVIRDSIRRSFAEIGEEALSDIVDEMPDDKASAAIRSVSRPDRIKILKLLYYGPKTYGEVAKAFSPDYPKSSLQYHLHELMSVKLIVRDDLTGNYRITNRGRSLLRLIAIFYGALKEGELEEAS
ncbi:MAG: hypothetical protein QXF26_07740 [Candidatus Bathyarchaeia archaeon]